MTEQINTTMTMTMNQTNIVTSRPLKEECEICGEVMNKSTHKKITCTFEVCSQSCCSKCFTRFIMYSGLSPVCMWCKKDISLESINDNTTKKFYAEYMDYRAGINVDRAKSELPNLQEQADAIIRTRNYTTELTNRKKDFYIISEKINRSHFELETVYNLFGITGRNPFSNPNHIKPTNWGRFLERATGLLPICSLCMKNSAISSCNRCNLSKCDNCFKLCLVANDTKCVICNTEDEITLGNIKKQLTQSFYNKFFKPKNRRQNKPEMQEFRVKTVETIRTKLEVNKEINTLCLDLYQIRNGFNFNRNHGLDEHVVNEEKKFIKKCPDSECRGFLSTAWKCGICSEFFCPDCHVKKNSKTDKEHVCDEAEKATIALLKVDCKPCPKCGIPIHRFIGCNHMFTTCCNIGFDWVSGKEIPNSRNTSPEYYAYMRRVNNGVVPREVNDNPCGTVDALDLITLIPFTDGIYRTDNKIDRYHQLMDHVNRVMIPVLPRTLDNFEREDLGVSYLVSDIDENTWKATLKKRIKKDEKNNHIFHILNMFVNVMNDFFRNLLTDRDFDTFFTNADQLISYTNSQIEKINKRYGSVSTEFFVVLRHY